MTKLITLIAIIVSFTTAQAQVTQVDLPKMETVGQVKKTGALIAELKESDGTYYLGYHNFKYTRISDWNTISFTATPEELETLYNFFAGAFTPENKKLSHKEGDRYEATFTLGNKVVMISSTKMLGVISVFVYQGGTYFILTQKEVNKLFGKK